ncbi:sensor histidine kinase [Microbacterium sp.]|uniref:sensor histidine kinase n=1 Tax=Microbacterium sp. TaxID=51671 RepID=UPI0039E35186
MTHAPVRTRSIWRWQLILAAATVAITATIMLIEPARLGDPAFLGGASGVVVLTCACLFVPWHRVPAAGVALLPYADIAAIALISVAGQTRASLLWVFPVAWIATYYRLPWLAAAIVLIGVFVTLDAFVGDLSPTLLQRAIVLVLCLGFMGVTINIGARRTRAISHLLRRQFTQLDRTRVRAQSEARRTALLADSLDTGLARIDRDSVLIDANAAFLRLYGAASISEFTPTGAVEYDDHRGRALGPDETLIARAAAGDRWVDRRVWLFDGEARWRALNVTMRPITPDVVETASNIVIVNDVTEAVAAERERATFSAVVSHELRNPLTAILGHAELMLERDDLPADIARQLGVIEHAGQRMERLVTTVLEGRSLSDEPFEPVDLRTVAEASLIGFGPTAASAGVALHHDLRGVGEVWGDAFRLRQAIDNVVGNAIKYTTRGGTVTMSAVHTAQQVRLTVADTGIGMAPHERDRMFDRGFRSDVARASGISGAGIGMSVVKEVVEQHHGALHVESLVGRGTRVTLVLPRLAETAERMPS